MLSEGLKQAILNTLVQLQNNVLVTKMRENLTFWSLLAFILSPGASY